MQDIHKVQDQRTIKEACHDFAFALGRCLLRLAYAGLRVVLRLSTRIAALALRRIGLWVLKQFEDR